MPTRPAQVPPQNRGCGGQQSHVDSIPVETASRRAYDRRGRGFDDPELNGSRSPGAFVLCGDERVRALEAFIASTPPAAPGRTGTRGRRGGGRGNRPSRLRLGGSDDRHIVGFAGRSFLSQEGSRDSDGACAAEPRSSTTRTIEGADVGGAQVDVEHGGIGEAARARKAFRRPCSRPEDRRPTVKGIARRDASGPTLATGQGPRCEVASRRRREAPRTEPPRPGPGQGS
jgi:hypothetical protein